ncbi:nephrocystin-4 isoform X1 [Tachysurus ichikawai]
MEFRNPEILLIIFYEYSLSHDPSVIVNAEEWRCFKDMTKTCTPLEVEMFHMKEDGSTPQVYLRPRESVHIPLKYQSFVSGHALLSQDSKTSTSLHFAQPQQSNTVRAKSIKVFFRAADSQPLAICQVRVEPTPHIVDQTFRFYQPELSFFKKAIRLPPAEPGTPDNDFLHSALSLLWDYRCLWIREQLLQPQHGLLPAPM